MSSPKYITYNGLRFCRDDKTGYYLNSTIRKRLHRYIWEQEVGPIPKGCHIHHLNGDKADNRIENLAILTASGHQRLHGQEQARKDTLRKNIEKARPAAIEWHKSEAGREWHSEHAKGSTQPRSEKACSSCGKLFMGTKLQQYCSKACKAKHRRDEGLDNVPMVCEACGVTFMASRFREQRFCSRKCAGEGHKGWTKRLKHD